MYNVDSGRGYRTGDGLRVRIVHTNSMHYIGCIYYYYYVCRFCVVIGVLCSQGGGSEADEEVSERR